MTKWIRHLISGLIQFTVLNIKFNIYLSSFTTAENYEIQNKPTAFYRGMRIIQ